MGYAGMIAALTLIVCVGWIFIDIASFDDGGWPLVMTISIIASVAVSVKERFKRSVGN